MIDARELRIGNWVGSKGRFGVVDGIWNLPNEVYKKVSFKGENILAEFPFSKIEPIPLTTEMEEDYLKNKADWVYRVFINNKPEYVHQLQNFHFIITGKELEIKV